MGDTFDNDGQATVSDFVDWFSSSTSEFLSLTDAFDNPASAPGIGRKHTHAAYLTDRTLSDRPAPGTHVNYYQRWVIESSIDQISNDLMPVISSSNKKLRSYGGNIAILLQNWHTLINRVPSPELGHRLDISHHQLRKAIEAVAFSTTTG